MTPLATRKEEADAERYAELARRGRSSTDVEAKDLEARKAEAIAAAEAAVANPTVAEIKGRRQARKDREREGKNKNINVEKSRTKAHVAGDDFDRKDSAAFFGRIIRGEDGKGKGAFPCPSCGGPLRDNRRLYNGQGWCDREAEYFAIPYDKEERRRFMEQTGTTS